MNVITIPAYFGHESETFRPYIHVDYARNPITFIWRAKTAKGRWSKHWHSVTVYGDFDVAGKLRKAETCSLPKLPNGYIWHGPLVYDCNHVEVSK